MGAYLSTDISGLQVVGVGGHLTGNITLKSLPAGNYYLVKEEVAANLVPIPGSRTFLRQATPTGALVNSTTDFTVKTKALGAVDETIPLDITLLNSDCYVFVYLKQISAVVLAGAFVPGTIYKIVSIGTTDFTLIGAVANTVGVVFTATGVGAGTGTACVEPDPTLDTTIDSVNMTVVSAAASTTGIDISSLMNLMITMMIIGMMMKMMTGIVKKT